MTAMHLRVSYYDYNLDMVLVWEKKNSLPVTFPRQLTSINLVYLIASSSFELQLGKSFEG